MPMTANTAYHGGLCVRNLVIFVAAMLFRLFCINGECFSIAIRAILSLRRP